MIKSNINGLVQQLDDLLNAIGIDKNKVCTYCWTGEE